MGRAAANGTPAQRECVLLWCAAATAALGAEVEPFLHDLLLPVHRATNASGNTCCFPCTAPPTLPVKPDEKRGIEVGRRGQEGARGARGGQRGPQGSTGVRRGSEGVRGGQRGSEG
eukprot:1065328-Prorocentrum_minimum.AAC.1